MDPAGQHSPAWALQEIPSHRGWGERVLRRLRLLSQAAAQQRVSLLGIRAASLLFARFLFLSLGPRPSYYPPLPWRSLPARGQVQGGPGLRWGSRMLGRSHRGPRREQLLSTPRKREHIEPGEMRVGLGLRESKLQELISSFSFAFPETSGERQCLVNNLGE